MVPAGQGRIPVAARVLERAWFLWRALLVLVAAHALSAPLHAGDTGTAEPTGPTGPGSDPPSVPVDYSILWPGLSAKYTVVTLDDALSFVAMSGHAGSVRSIELRKAVSREGFDACMRLVQALEAEFSAAGLTANVEPVRRAKPGDVQSLSRSDLPPSPRGRYVVDVVISYIGLAASTNGSDWEPRFSLKWRVLSPRGDILVPTHAFWHGPDPAEVSDRNSNRTSDCNLPRFKSIMADPAPLWSCFDRAFHNASRDLVQVVVAAQKPAQSHTKAPP